MYAVVRQTLSSALNTLFCPRKNIRLSTNSVLIENTLHIRYKSELVNCLYGSRRLSFDSHETQKYCGQKMYLLNAHSFCFDIQRFKITETSMAPSFRLLYLNLNLILKIIMASHTVHGFSSPLPGASYHVVIRYGGDGASITLTLALMRPFPLST